jgi:glycolate oxidase
MFGKLNASIIKEIENIIGKENIIEEKEKLVDYSHDEFSLTDIQHEPEIVITPTSSIKISEIMKIASKEKIPVTTRGGGTGLCGGCVPVYGGIVLSTEKMKNIVEIDEENLMVTLEAGVTLKEFYSEIKKKKLFFPPHPGEESATIGGIISTNAGGARAVKYGTIRNFVRGIEIVLASDKIIRAGGKIIKDSTGYSLVNLFTGSEGTLGIITQATFSVLPEPDSFITLLVPFLSIVDALNTVPLILKSSIKPLAIEFISRKIVSILTRRNFPDDYS